MQKCGAHYINISYKKPAIGNPGLRGQKNLEFKES